MPGKKDFISVRNTDGEKVHQQKRLVLCNSVEGMGMGIHSIRM